MTGSGAPRDTPTKLCPRCRRYLDAALFLGASGKEHKNCRPCLDQAALAYLYPTSRDTT